MKCDNSLNKVLENRELRQAKQWKLIDDFNSTVLSLTINIPGCKKDSSDAKFIYDEAIKEIKNLELKEHEEILTCKDTGYEALWSLHVNPNELKILTCKIEENHPLGRFMDIDVIDNSRKILSRKSSRKCYICNEDAKICARSRKHSIPELLAYISKTVDDYRLSI